MKPNKSLTKRFMPLIIILAVIMTVAAVATPTIAYYIRTAGEVKSEYSPALPDTPSFADGTDNPNGGEDESSDQSFELGKGTDKITNVSIKVPDKGYAVYVRVAILVTWKRHTPCTCTNCSDDCKLCTNKESCPVCGTETDVDVDFESPVLGDDFILTTGEAWGKKLDGFYYYTTPIESSPDEKVKSHLTPILIKECYLNKPREDDFILSVEVIVQTVQAVGSTDDDKKLSWQDAWNISSMS